METFDDYKKTIELNVINLEYLYAGDVINSIDYVSSIKSFQLSHSPSFIIESITDIYNKSILNMINLSKNVDVSDQLINIEGDITKHGDIDRVIKLMSKEIGEDVKFLFMSGLSASRFKYFNNYNSSSLPSYIFRTGSIRDTTIYMSPIINDSDDEILIYGSTKPIQSLIYVITNMNYKIDGVRHTIESRFYQTDYKSICLKIKNISKWRNDRIDIIMNDI